MATGLLALLDDITSILDDVSAMTKVAAGKTAGVLGDDLALNAQQVAEVRADRELPVVWAVAKRLRLEQGHPGPHGAGDQRLRALARDAAADAGWRLSLLRGRGKAGTSMAARGGTRSACASPV